MFHMPVQLKLVGQNLSTGFQPVGQYAHAVSWPVSHAVSN